MVKIESSLHKKPHHASISKCLSKHREKGRKNILTSSYRPGKSLIVFLTQATSGSTVQYEFHMARLYCTRHEKIFQKI